MLLALGLPAAARQPDTVRVVFVGDVMSHGPQVTAALRHGGNPANPADYDYGSYFQYVQPWFQEADLVVANMEFPVGVLPYSGYPFFSAPPALPDEAKRSHVTVFLTANNHLCDRGRVGLDSTYVNYSRLGVPFTGFYRSAGEEYENDPLILNIRGHRIALATGSTPRTSRKCSPGDGRAARISSSHFPTGVKSISSRPMRHSGNGPISSSAKAPMPSSGPIPTSSSPWRPGRTDGPWPGRWATSSRTSLSPIHRSACSCR